MRTGLSSEWISELKANNDIIKIISKYANVQKKGKTHWACCPFHIEKTPSFAINEYEQFFHCFGCGASGDVIKFVEKIEAVDFYDACKILATNSHMQMPEISGDNEDIKQKKKKKETYLKMLKDTANYYHMNLVKIRPMLAMNYIKKRGLDASILKTFGIGYSLGWNEVVDYLSRLGYTKEDMLDSGICERKNNNLFDAQSKRLIFPIINSYGDVVGFSARLLEEADFAKYKNTAQTLIFDKSKCVYNINSIKNLKHENNLNEVIMVEGQMDVISLYKNGFKNAVACMGTALTSFHAREIKRFLDKVVVCFDGDNAGKQATLRSLEILVNAGLNVYVAVLPDGLDPDDYLNKNSKDDFEKLIKNAKYWVEYLINTIYAKYNHNKPEEKSKFIKESLFVIKKLSSVAEQDIYLNMLKELSNISISVLREDMRLAKDDFIEVEEKKDSALPSRDNAFLKAVKFVLAALLHKKKYAKVNGNIKESLKNPDNIMLYEYIEKMNKEGKTPIVSALFDMFDVEDNKEIYDIINYEFSAENDNLDYYEDCIKYLVKVGLEGKLQEISRALTAETDLDKRRQLSKETQMIILKLKGNN